MSPPEGEPDVQGFITERNPQLRLIIPGVVAVAFLMEQLDQTIIVTAVPQMAQSLQVSPLALNLAITTYILALAIFIPVSGWFADRFGARLVFVGALIVFTLGSILCGMAQNFPMLIATRAVQGFGGAMMTPVGRLILIRSFPRSQLITAMTYMTLPAILGPVIGPLLGGVLTQYLSWRWVFFVNIPFGAVGIVMALRFLEDTRSDAAAKFDFPGFLMVGIGFCLFEYGIENVGRPTIPIVAVAAVLLAALALLTAFFFYARRVPTPAVDLTLFRQRSFRISTLFGGLCRVGYNGVPFLLPLMLQVGFGVSPVVSGSLTFVSALSSLIVRPVLRHSLRLVGFKAVLIFSAVAGMFVVGAFAFINPDTPYWIIVLLIAVFGLARATQFMSSNTLTYADVPAEQLSRATSLGGVIQQLSVSFGVSIGAMLLGLVTWGGAPLTTDRFHEVFLLAAIVPLLGIPGFIFLTREDGASVSGYEGRRVVAEAETAE
jgi:EmrB/QacA subfamily drug resistance transporter